ncbi:MAG: GNAT family N-acetyltransferase [Desulfonatronovibrionaceae bacterium]
MGMETLPEFRRAGLGTAVTAKLIDYCLEKNLEPIWACRDGNQASYKLAIKLGFEPIAYLPYYELKNINSIAPDRGPSCLSPASGRTSFVYRQQKPGG